MASDHVELLLNPSVNKHYVTSKMLWNWPQQTVAPSGHEYNFYETQPGESNHCPWLPCAPSVCELWSLVLVNIITNVGSRKEILIWINYGCVYTLASNTYIYI